MNYLDLRRHYPIFSFTNFDYHLENSVLDINFNFSAGNHTFIHKLKINNVEKTDDQIEKYIFNIGLSLLPSYWKLFCSPIIQIQNPNINLSDQDINFWHKLYIKGMGEYFYKNQIDFTQENFLNIKCAGESEQERNGHHEQQRMVGEHLQSLTPSKKVLIPVGGGKDSIVTLELLKPHYDVTAFTINPVPTITDVIKTSGVPTIFAENIFDPHLFELNEKGFLNGHVPISAFYAFTSIFVAHLQNISYVAFSNEASSNEGNVTYLSHEINHQYSKTLEFETDLNSYLKNITPIKCFSFLRPIYELKITQLFSKYPQYFNIFSSCNNNFKQSTNNLKPKTRWCQNCPKCISTSLMLARFIGKEKVTEIMGSFPNNPEILDQLTGVSPIKPFECVLTRAEANAAISGENLDQIISSWQNNPNLPKDFAKLLKSAL